MNTKTRSFGLLGLLASLAAMALAPPAWAAATDIANTPLVVASPNAVQPNLIFVLDDSGSMDFDFMPDHVAGAQCRSAGATATATGSFGNACCQGGNTSNACWRGNAPFGSLRGHPPFLSASFNNLAYNPAISYTPPVSAAGVSWNSQTSGNTSGWTNVRNDAYGIQNTGSINLLTQFPDSEYCVDDGSFSDCLRNDNYVLPGTVNGKAYTRFHETTASGSGSKASGAPDNPSTAAQSWGPHYYNIIASEYCDGPNLRNCQSTQTSVYRFAAPLRWCSSDAETRKLVPAANSCQAVRTGTYAHARYPTRYFTAGTAGTAAVIEVPASTSFTLNNPSCTLAFTSVRVNGVNLLSANTSSSNDRNTLGSSMASRINSGGTGYTAVSSNGGRTVTITAPASAGAITHAVSFTRTPTNCSYSFTYQNSTNVPPFSGYVAPKSATAGTPAGYPGSFQRVDIIPSRTSYPKASTRVDCAGTTCTYAEEMTNFANWWTYYHSRMQSMKSSASLAFAAVGSNYRVGYMSINNAQGNAWLNPATFSGTTKTTWFSRMIAARPNSSTPLRTALSTVGRIYSGTKTGSFNGGTIVDPMQYSCQRNYTILSTDGFWNEAGNPPQLNGSSEIGDQDNALARPQFDGNSTANTLADVAAYYYNTDLRTSSCTSGSSGVDVCGTGTANELQRMVTFTLGLGASGYMQFDPDYLRASSGDYFAIKEGLTPNVSAGICTWQSSGECTWPAPVSNTLTTIDDLWHAAVNGGGSYFSASDPNTLYKGLVNTLASIEVVDGAAAAATTSTPNVSSGDNQVFVSNFWSGEWTGELKGHRIDLDDGTVSGTSEWSARNLLETNTTRKIYMFNSAATNKRKEFIWSEMSASEKSNFELGRIAGNGTALSQFCSFGTYCLNASTQSSAAGEMLVRFLRGERTNEGPVTDPAKYYRERKYLLGDIVNSEAAYVGKAQLSFTDTGYAEHKAAVASRESMVYVGANDGMLHAIKASTGQEVWAYVPTAVLPKMYKLADKNYPSQHEYFVDGSAVVQDIYDGSSWRTILVSGLGAGGRAYFAIDVTDPSDPKPMWEFTHDNLGLTFGKAEIGKLADGTWAVMLPSGYNNVSPGDGNGRLFVLNAVTGAAVAGIPNGIPTLSAGLEAGSTTTPSGLAHIRAWADNAEVNNTAMRVYGGDNLGNLWRFDINNNVGAAGIEAQRLATLKSAGGLAQPITSRPELGKVDTHVMIYVGTGRYLGSSDVSDTTPQSIYAIKDRLSATDYANPRTPANNFVQQTLTEVSCPSGSTSCTSGQRVRTNANPLAVDLYDKNGWYVDLPTARERVNTDPVLVLGTLVVNTNVIDPSAICSVGGNSWINYFDYRTGAPVSTANGISSLPLGNSIATRPSIVKLPNNKVIAITRLSSSVGGGSSGSGSGSGSGGGGDGDRNVETPVPISSSPGPTRRLSWRELSVE